MKAKIYQVDGKSTKTIDLPSCFSEAIREDVISKVLESRKTIQPYAPSLVAGKQHSAAGLLVHRRHVWRSGYGKGQSRIPRKIMTRKGSQFNMVGAGIPSVRGGPRAHPPKVIKMLSKLKVNKKEMKLAFVSALSATVDSETVMNKYARLEGKKINNLPLVSESKITTLKTKELLSSLKNILGEDLYKIAIQTKAVRSGKGKARGRKYKSNAGLLMVVGKEEKLKTTAFDVVKVSELGVTDLAKGGAGRLTMYTENAIKELGERFK